MPTIRIELTDDAAMRLRELAERDGCGDDIGRMIQRALTTYEWIVAQRLEGRNLYVKWPNEDRMAIVKFVHLGEGPHLKLMD